MRFVGSLAQVDYEAYATGILDTFTYRDAEEQLTIIQTRTHKFTESKQSHSFARDYCSREPSGSTSRKLSQTNLGKSSKRHGSTSTRTYVKNVDIWGNSVLDEATKDDFPCLRFVAHRHCQSLLQAYFSGEYIGSRASIAHDAKLSQIMGQMILQMIQLICFGLLPHRWAHFFVNVRTPRFRLRDNMVTVGKEVLASKDDHQRTQRSSGDMVSLCAMRKPP